MKITAEKPTFLPQISFFARMLAAETFVLADNVRFISQDYLNRAPVSAPDGKQWLTVPVLSGGRVGQAINSVRIDTSRHWRRKQWKAISLNYAYAPYFDYYADFFENLYRRNWEFLIDLNLAVIEYFCKTFAFDGRLVLSSELAISSKGTRQIVDICAALGGDQYLAWESDKKFLKTALFDAAGIDLGYLNFHPFAYRPATKNRSENLSIIDLLFYAGPDSKQVLKKSLIFKK